MVQVAAAFGTVRSHREQGACTALHWLLQQLSQLAQVMSTLEMCSVLVIQAIDSEEQLDEQRLLTAVQRSSAVRLRQLVEQGTDAGRGFYSLALRKYVRNLGTRLE